MSEVADDLVRTYESIMEDEQLAAVALATSLDSTKGSSLAEEEQRFLYVVFRKSESLTIKTWAMSELRRSSGLNDEIAEIAEFYARGAHIPQSEGASSITSDSRLRVLQCVSLNLLAAKCLRLPSVRLLLATIIEHGVPAEVERSAMEGFGKATLNDKIGFFLYGLVAVENRAILSLIDKELKRLALIDMGQWRRVAQRILPAALIRSERGLPGADEMLGALRAKDGDEIKSAARLIVFSGQVTSSDKRRAQRFAEGKPLRALSAPLTRLVNQTVRSFAGNSTLLYREGIFPKSSGPFGDSALAERIVTSSRIYA